MITVLLCCISICAGAQVQRGIPVNIFGDGVPGNGIEDNRQQLYGGTDSGLSLAEQRGGAGTVECDGKIRGTATVVDTSGLVNGLAGVVLASSAHVFYDLDEKRLFSRCEFHYLGLDELSGYRARIDLGTTIMGDYDPERSTGGLDFGEGDWAFLYVPKPWRSFNPDEVTPLLDFHSLQLESFQQSGGEFRLIAFDSTGDVLSVSRHCTVIESEASDLGGGGWSGQLLDNCDSADGASGGGLLAIMGGRQFLVGIRNGSHWSEEAFPVDAYPEGPPDGSIWDRNTNTNFARGIDHNIINKFKKFIKHIEIKENKKNL